MSSCIICGKSVDGHICASHEEDVVFEFRGDRAGQLVPGRYYRGTVDGYADFGVFIDIGPSVTGLLHRSELDQRLESLDWETGDEVFVQVQDIRDNGDIDLGWSIRQAERDFRGSLIQKPEGDELPESETETETQAETDGTRDGSSTSVDSAETNASASADTGGSGSTDGGRTAEATARSGGDTDAPHDSNASASAEAESAGATEAVASETEPDTDGDRDAESRPEGEAERAEIGSLSERVGEAVRIEGEVVGARQTGGPTVFELRDETGVVDCAAFVEAGVRAYPEVEVGDMVRLDGEVEVRRDEIQVETEALAALDGDDRETVEQRLADALSDRARPSGVKPLAGDDVVADAADELLDAAEAIRRAVLESRPIVVRHAATADGYVAGAAVERSVLPLIRDEHARSDAEYHYFDRRPLEDPVYGMDAATNDVSRMLQDRDRHDEKLPLVLLMGVGGTAESADGLGLLGVYDARRVVVDATGTGAGADADADAEVSDEVDALVSPDAEATDASAGRLSTGALGANLAAAVNDDVRDDLAHLPAVSYWEDVPEAYVDLASEAGYDDERVAHIREAIELEAYYQAYEDKRELVADLLFGDDAGAGASDAEAGDLADHISEQFRRKLDTEVTTAAENLDEFDRDGVDFAVLDADAYTHRFDFPPTTLLLDELHRRNREGERFVTVGVGRDELHLRSTADLDVRAVAEAAAEAEPDAGIDAVGVRVGRIEFLAGARDRVREAVIDAVADRV